MKDANHIQPEGLANNTTKAEPEQGNSLRDRLLKDKKLLVLASEIMSPRYKEY